MTDMDDALVQRMGYAARQNQSLIEEIDRLRAEVADMRKALVRLITHCQEVSTAASSEAEEWAQTMLVKYAPPGEEE